MTEKFKEESKKQAYKNRLGKVDLGTETITNADTLTSFEIVDSCISNGVIIGNTNAKSIKLKTQTNYNLSDAEIIPFVGVKYDDESEEYLRLGKYTIKSETNDKTASVGEYDGLDVINKLEEPYVCSIEKETEWTIQDFYIDVCNQAGLTPKNTEFLNSDIVIEGNPFTNNESRRIVLQNIAQVACSFVNIDWETEEIDLAWFDEEYADTIDKSAYSTLEKNQVFGPVNRVVIKDGVVEGENVVREDKEEISQNGECEISIEGNYFLFTEDLRAQAIEKIWERVKGFSYVDCKITSYTGMPYLKRGNKIKVQDSDDTYFDTYVLTHTFTYDGTFTSIIESPALTKTETKLQNNQTVLSRFRRVERTCDRINGQMSDVIEQVGEYDEKITNIEQTANQITQEVEEVIDAVRTANGVNQLTLEDCTEGYLVYLSLRGNISLLYPALDLYPAEDLYPLDTYLIITHQDGNDSRVRLPINYLNAMANVYDEFIVDCSDFENSSAYIIRRIGVREDGTKYVLDEEKIEMLGTVEIPLKEGVNTLRMESFDGITFNVKYAINNKFTDMFAKKVDVKSQIKQTADAINLEVSQKVDEKEFGTKLRQSAEDIQFAWNQIGQNIKIEIINGKACLCIYDKNDELLMTLNEDGQAFYRDNQQIGLQGVKTERRYVNSEGQEYVQHGIVNYLACHTDEEGNNPEGNGSFITWTAAMGAIEDGDASADMFGFYTDPNAINGGHIVANVPFSCRDVINCMQINALFFGGQRDSGTVIFFDDKYNNVRQPDGTYTSDYYATDIIFQRSDADSKVDFQMPVNFLYSPTLNGQGNVVFSWDDAGARLTQVSNIHFHEDSGYEDVIACDDSGTTVTLPNQDFVINSLSDIWNALVSSDKKLKKNIKETKKTAIDDIKKIKVKEYDWKKDGKHESIGLIAQELKELDESYVQTFNVKEEQLGLNLKSLLALCIKGLQEQQVEIDKLKEQINEKNNIHE